MAKLMKTKNHKITPKKVVAKSDNAVLVGTYKEKQLAWIKKHGVYNYPVKEEDERGRIALSLIPYVGGWKVDDGVYINRRRRIFGVVAANDQWMNLASFAVGIVIGCKGAKVYIVVESSKDEKRIGRVPKAFQPFIDVVTNEVFFNLVVGRESAYQDLCSAIDDVRRKRKPEKEVL